MNDDRLMRLFGASRRAAARVDVGQVAVDDLQGFMSNPLGETVTPAQVLMYQTAYQRARNEQQKEEWPLAENWN